MQMILFFCSDKSSDTVSNFLQEDLANVSDWLHANKLSLHIGKTTSMLICNNQKRKSLNSNLGLSLNGTEVNQSDECKYLGVTFDQEFRFDSQIDEIVNKLKKALGVFSRAAKFLMTESQITLYNTLVLPHLDYCATFWILKRRGISGRTGSKKG